MPDGATATSPRPLWHVSIAGRLRENLDEAGLRLLASRGQLAPHTPIQRAGTAEWRLLAAVPELAALLSGQNISAPSATPMRFKDHLKTAGIILWGLILAVYWIWRLGGLDLKPKYQPNDFVDREQLLRTAQTHFRERRWADGLAACRQCESKGPLAAADRQGLAELVLQNMGSDQHPPTPATAQALQLCLAWSPNRVNQVADLCLTRARSGLQANPLPIGDVESLLKLATDATSITEPRIASLVWEGLSRRLADPSSLGREALAHFYQVCDNDEWLSDTVRTEPAWRLAQALLLHEQGRRRDSLPIFEDLATTSGSAAMTNVAKDILSPPKPGCREIRRPATVLTRDRKGRPAISIHLQKVQVGKHKIEVDFRLYNASLRRQTFVFAGKIIPTREGESYHLFSVTDDNGRIDECAAQFSGGGMIKDIRSDLRGIELASGEGAEIKARFPMISPGASLVSFSAPAYPNQSSWGWERLPLKAGPFGPPLPVLPLADASLMLPEAEAVAVATPQTNTSTPLAVSDKATPEAAPQAAPKLPPVSVSAKPAFTPEATPTPLPEKREPLRMNTPAPAVKRIEPQASPSAADPQRQAYLARRDALQARARCQPQLRGKKGLLKRGLFESAETQRQSGEQAERAGDYARAALYFEQAARIYKSVEN